MTDLGSNHTLTLPDGRSMDYWDGGDPDGRPLVFQPGTPSARAQGKLMHHEALAAGLRVLSISRPGYGASTRTPPGLASVGADAAAMAGALGLGSYAVLGASGGGPFAVATAVADPEHVTVLGIASGVGLWPLLSEPDEASAEERGFLATAEGGDIDGALAAFTAAAQRDMGPLLALDDDGMVRAFLSGAFPPDSPRLSDAEFLSIWAEDVRESLQSFDGYARDNLSWGGTWDSDPRNVRVPALLWYGDADPVCPPAHGEWLAEQIPHSRLTIRQGEGHGQAIMDHWAHVFSEILAVWH